MKPVAFDYHRAQGIQDALSALDDDSGDVKAMAGGCSLGPMLNLRLARPTRLVDLRAVADLRQVADTGDALVVGAMWTHAEIEDGLLPDVTRGFLPHVAHGIAYRAVRNRGTIGGSLAHADPAADWISTLLALDARVAIRGPGGDRQVAVNQFMLGAYTTDLADGELVTAIVIPKLSPGARWAYHKICRKTGEFAKAIGAVVFDPARGFARVVCGAVESVPVVLEESSAALRQNGPEAASAAAESEVERVLASHDAVSRRLHLTAVQRALAELGTP